MHNTFMYFIIMYSKELLKGTISTIILRLLTENEEMYGYEITHRVKELTKNKINITEGALYPALHRLEAEGLLTTKTVNIGKRIRKYYSLTKQGNAVEKNKMAELEEFLGSLKLALNLKTI